MHTHMYTDVLHLYIHTLTWIYIHACIRACIHMTTYLHDYTPTLTHVYTMSCMNVCIHTVAYIYSHA